MKNNCKWWINEKTCGYGNYKYEDNGTVRFIRESLIMCEENCKGFYDKKKYYEDIKNPVKYLKDNNLEGINVQR